MMVALSLVMVACNKDENELSYWDKVLNEMGETELSAIDVLESLRENEHWEITTEYKYFLRDGKVVEEMTSGEGLFVTKLVGPGRVILQTQNFNDFAGRIIAMMPKSN